MEINFTLYNHHKYIFIVTVTFSDLKWTQQYAKLAHIDDGYRKNVI